MYSVLFAFEVDPVPKRPNQDPQHVFTVFEVPY
jgi:hypothetical protein